MTITENTTAAIPAITLPADYAETLAEGHALVEQIRASITRLVPLAHELRDGSDDILLALGRAGLPIDEEETHALVDRVTGFAGGGGLWDVMTALVDPISSDTFGTTGLRGTELRRGGVRDHKIGTIACIEHPDGGSITVRVRHICQPDDTYTVQLVAPDGSEAPTWFRASHDEIATGIPGRVDWNTLPAYLTIGLSGNSTTDNTIKATDTCTSVDVVAAINIGDADDRQLAALLREFDSADRTATVADLVWTHNRRVDLAYAEVLIDDDVTINAHGTRKPFASCTWKDLRAAQEHDDEIQMDLLSRVARILPDDGTTVAVLIDMEAQR